MWQSFFLSYCLSICLFHSLSYFFSILWTHIPNSIKHWPATLSKYTLNEPATMWNSSIYLTKFVLEGIFQQMLLLETDVTEVLWSLELLIIGGKNGEKKNTCPNFHFFSTGVKTAWEHSWPSCHMVATIIMATDLNQHFKRTTKHNFAICQATLSASLHDRITSANRVS